MELMGIERIETPALVLDMNALERNIAGMAAFFKHREAKLRPHFKTHKCPQICKLQLAAGAKGITCAKLSEAEVLADAGVGDILIANQIVEQSKLERLAELAQRVTLTVAVDNAHNVDALAAAAQKHNSSIKVLVEVNVGMNRCGVDTAEATLALAQQIVRSQNLIFEGIQAYEGHLVLNADEEVRTRGVSEMQRKISGIVAALNEQGLAVREISGGGTGTYNLTGVDTIWTEMQAGSYVFMDATYAQLDLPFEHALTVLSTVMHKRSGFAVTDAGHKAVTSEFGLPALKGLSHVSFQGLSEEHGKLLDPDDELAYLQKVEYIPSHCCTTVNLYDQLYCVRDGVLVEVWNIAGRGKSQ